MNSDLSNLTSVEIVKKISDLLKNRQKGFDKFLFELDEELYIELVKRTKFLDNLYSMTVELLTP